MNPAYKWYVDMLTAWPLLEHSFWKDYFIDGWYIPATAEAVRRYYSAKHFRTTGPFNVATGVWPWLQFAKFFDFLDLTTSLTFRPDNKHFSLFSLKKTLERFSHFPIKTSPEEKEPRLLLVTVDVKTGDAVTFDSYNNEAKYHDNKNSISNKRGIEVEHALASGTFPDFFDYPKFKVNNAEKGIQNEEENIFWDGGFRSNTPLREVLQAHRDYWLSLARKKHQNEEDYEYENDVPDLEVYIADLWPSELKEGPISFDRDFVENRKWDLLFADKTHYDEQIANVVTDYIDLARRLKNLAERKGASKEEVDYILNSKASSINTIGKTRIYKELLEGRFRLTKVVRIDRKDDGNEVHNKVFDYSYKSIEDLMSVGYQDASIQMDLQQMKEGIMELIIINGHVSSSSSGIEKQQENHQIEKLEEGFRKIEESIKNENGYGYNTTKLVEDFMGQIELIEGLNENKTFLEEKASLIAAAKQLQNTINMIIKKIVALH
jgi:NTE family protein